MNFVFEYDSFKPTVSEKIFNIDDEMSRAYQRNESKIKNEEITHNDTLCSLQFINYSL